MLKSRGIHMGNGTAIDVICPCPALLFLWRGQGLRSQTDDQLQPHLCGGVDGVICTHVGGNWGALSQHSAKELGQHGSPDEMDLGISNQIKKGPVIGCCFSKELLMFWGMKMIPGCLFCCFKTRSDWSVVCDMNSYQKAQRVILSLRNSNGKPNGNIQETPDPVPSAKRPWPTSFFILDSNFGKCI